MSASREVVEAAWGRVVYDCGCPDLYYCPAAVDVECPRHGGFGVCCDRLDEHVPLPSKLRAEHPRPPLPREDLAEA